MKIRHSGKSVKGRTRFVNQDSYRISYLGEDASLFIVCDGMGGHNGGEVASSNCVGLLADEFENNYDKNSPSKWLIEAVKKTNNTLYNKANANPDLVGMGTTMVALLITPDTAYCASVGDSRIYLLDEGFRQVTEDDSEAWELYKQGLLTKDEILDYPRKNLLTAAMALNRDVFVHTNEQKINENQTYLLCTDGLTDYLTDDKIHAILSESIDAQQKVEKMIEKALANKSDDDITVLMVEINAKG
jgi:protein phosphatase